MKFTAFKSSQPKKNNTLLPRGYYVSRRKGGMTPIVARQSSEGIA